MLALRAPLSAQSLRAFETLDQGLPSVRACGGVQFADGRVAFACDAGLATYDGRRWDVDASLLQVVAQPRWVVLDAEGRPWVAGEQARMPLAHRRDGAWHALPSPGPTTRSIDSIPVHLEVLPDGHLLYATGAGVYEHDGERWSTRATRAELGGRARAVATFDGTIVIGSETGLALWRGGALTTWPLPEWLASSAILALAVEAGPEPLLWVLGTGGVASARAAGGELVTRSRAAFDVEAPHLVLPDGADGLWIGAPTGLRHTEKDRVRSVRRDTHVQTWQGVNGLLRDREGVLWIAHDRGVHRVPSARFEIWRRLDGLLQDDVTAIVESPPGRIVFAHPDGLSFLEGGRLRTRRLESDIIHVTRTLSLSPDAAGNLWISRSRGGALRLAPDGSVERIELPVQAFATSVLVDSRQRVWLTTFDDLYRWDGSRFVVDQPLSQAAVRRVLELADGRLALATARAGIALLEDEAWRWLERSDEKPSNSTYDVLLRTDGTLMVASDGGLLYEHGGALARWRDGSFELDEPVYTLVEVEGELWAGTRDGVVRWDGERARRYGHAQGLASQEINRAGLLLDSSGSLWIGGVGGASRYRPEFDRPDLAEPRLSLTAVLQDGRAFAADRPQRLAHDQNDLEFAFHAISFADGGRVAYRFRLHGYDDDWIEDPRASEGGLVRYTNLPPGSYSFEVAARAGDSPWSPSVSTAQVQIASPFWHTAWFAVLAVALLSALGWGANNLILQRRRNTQLDALVLSRTEELVAAERGYREVFEQSRAPQLLVDGLDGTITAANPAAEAFYGLPSADLVGTPFTRAVVPDEGDDALDLRRLASGQGRRFECALHGAGGEVREVELYASAHTRAGRATVQVLLHDVTEQRRLQEKLVVAQRMESIGLLAGGIAHDFNNILTVILGNVELALGQIDGDDPGSEGLQRELLQIRESGQRAAGLTRQLLEFSRRRLVRFEPLDLNAIVRELEPLARRLTREDIDLVVDLDDALEPILAERSQVEQVVFNLVVNASEAMPRGGRTTIVTRAVELDSSRPGAPAGLIGRFALLEITDTGVGMDAATARRVFEPFFSSKPLGTGTGLGLATLHGIVEQAGGRVEVESQVGHGSTFRVWLPIAGEPAGATVVPAPPPPRAPAQPANSETILLCEDDEALRVLATRLLSSAGYRVLPAGAPSRALELAEDTAQEIDLLVTDVILPERNGRELAEAVLVLRPGVPVLYISGYTADVIARHGMLGSGIELLHKPFRAPELLERVRAILDRAAAEPLASGAGRGRGRGRGERT